MEEVILDPITIGIITSLIANGLSSLSSFGISRMRDISKLNADLRKTLKNDDKLISIIRKVMEDIFNNTEFTSNSLRKTMIQLFFESPTAENIVRQIFSDILIEGNQHKSVTQLKEEFQICLSQHLGVDKGDIGKISNTLFDAILSGCQRAFDLSIEKNILSAHEAKSVSRHKVLIDEILSIKKNLDFLKTHSKLDVEAISFFEDRYRGQVGSRTRKITVPHFDKSLRVDIKEIFVSPNFVQHLSKDDVKSKLLNLDDFTKSIYRTVLLGDPGGGKSTFAQKICHDLCGNYEKRLIGNRLLTPILVVLRDYSVKKKRDSFSIIQFIEHEVTSKYQFAKEPPEGAFEYLLHNGHAFVIFDGLDELLDPSERREVTKDIESFCNLFPSINILVTSRIVGYEQAPLDTKEFSTFTMSPFNDKQVNDYAVKWFGQDASFSPEKRRERTKNFMEESQIVSDLRSNPLLLALMCNLYRGSGFIPKNRPEVYKKCSQMLFEHWDLSRGIRWANLPISEPRILLSNLAFWIYSNESLQGGVTEDKLISQAIKVLRPSRFEYKEEAEKASKEFINFCKGRAWVFTDVGTTPDGIPLYKFTHKTFLEYFTAVYLVRNNSIPENLWKILKLRLTDSSWNEIAQLSMQLIHEHVERGSEKVLELLINDSKSNIPISWNYISFGVQCLQFLYPSPKIVRELATISIKYVITNSSSIHKKENKPDFFKSDIIDNLLGSLTVVALQNRQTVADAIYIEILHHSKSDDDIISLCALDIGLNFHIFINKPSYKKSPELSLFDYWFSFEERVFQKVKTRLLDLSSKNFNALYYLVHRDEKKIKKIFEWYKPDKLFFSNNSLILSNLFHSSIAFKIICFTQLFNIPIPSRNARWLLTRKNQASEIGKIMEKVKLPCFSSKIFSKPYSPHFYLFMEQKSNKLSEIKKDDLTTISISGHSFFGLWCLFATILESERGSHLISETKKNENNPIIKVILDSNNARDKLFSTKELLKNLSQYNLSEPSLKVIKQWINNEISFIY